MSKENYLEQIEILVNNEIERNVYEQVNHIKQDNIKLSTKLQAAKIKEEIEECLKENNGCKLSFKD